MIICPSCQHPRLLHDGWGCKDRCGCGVSIVYLTPLLPLQPEAAVEEQIEQGNALVRQADRREELQIMEQRQPPLRAQAPPALQ